MHGTVEERVCAAVSARVHVCGVFGERAVAVWVVSYVPNTRDVNARVVAG